MKAQVSYEWVTGAEDEWLYYCYILLGAKERVMVGHIHSRMVPSSRGYLSEYVGEVRRRDDTWEHTPFILLRSAREWVLNKALEVWGA